MGKVESVNDLLLGRKQLWRHRKINKALVEWRNKAHVHRVEIIFRLIFFNLSCSVLDCCYFLMKMVFIFQLEGKMNLMGEIFASMRLRLEVKLIEHRLKLLIKFFGS